MKTTDLLLNKDEIYRAGQNYFKSKTHLTHSEYTHAQASLKALKWVQQNFHQTSEAEHERLLFVIKEIEDAQK
jgi:hypothetical protein